MANTLNLGNGNWAVKQDSLLAYNDENENFKPLPFTFSRASNATVVNKDGLIETVGSGEPRIDFQGNTKGALLLEPSRTNLIPYSTAINSWSTKIGVVVTDNDTISPDGSQNASKLVFDGTTNARIEYGLSVSAGVQYTISAYVKTDSDNATFGLGTGAGAELQYFTATTEWQRFTVTLTSSGATEYPQLRANNETIYLWGIQYELGSYSTSLINTSGSAVTRVVDNISLTLPDTSSFNSSNGFSVITKFDIGEAGTGTSSSFLFFSDDTSNTYIGFGSTNTLLRCRLNLNGTAYLNTQNNALRTQRNSLFVSCDASGWSQGANGVTNFTGTNDASVFNKLANITCSSSDIFGIIKISELLVYNTRLTNAELQQLTS